MAASERIALLKLVQQDRPMRSERGPFSELAVEHLVSARNHATSVLRRVLRAAERKDYHGVHRALVDAFRAGASAQLRADRLAVARSLERRTGSRAWSIDE